LILATYCKSKRKSIIALKIVIIKMKQTAAVSLGILGLNEDFVQVNEIMNFKKTLSKNDKHIKIKCLCFFIKNIDKF
jgi:hypothetical protein